MQDINKLLIENILPSSVAAKFLSPNRITNNKVNLFKKNNFNNIKLIYYKKKFYFIYIYIYIKIFIY